MGRLIGLVPGVVAALAAFAVLKLTAWVGSVEVELLIFLVTYLVVAVLADAAMRGYGKTDKS